MSEATLHCEQCNAEIYQEHIAKRQAGRVAGKLLCPLCVSEKVRERQAAKKAGEEAVSHSGILSAPAAKESGASGIILPAAAAGASGVIAAPPRTTHGEADEPLSLVSESGAKEHAAPATMRAFVKSSLAQEDRHDTFNREMVEASRGATRCRTFHSKLTDAAFSYLDNQVNEWVDAHPEIFIKFATSTIGLLEAKQQREPHVIMTVFY